MQTLIDWLKWVVGLANPDNLQKAVNLWGPPWVGYLVLAAIIFSETGLLVGFFLPGDSLLFTTGFLCSKEIFSIFPLMTVLSVAAILGDAVNYQIGLRMGEHVFEKGKLKFVKHKHLMAAKAFYEKHGGKAIIMARFVPLIRTFTPFVAGVARMNYRQFVLYNIVGGIGWVVSMTVAGYFLGQLPWVQANFEKVVLMIIIISVLPVIIGAWRSRHEAGESTPS
ncbi:MAG: VTT domain-containing protein [Planctomycetaceae bacterium]